MDIINALVNEYGVDPNSKVKLLYLALCLVVYHLAHLKLLIWLLHNLATVYASINRYITSYP